MDINTTQRTSLPAKLSPVSEDWCTQLHVFRSEPRGFDLLFWSFMCVNTAEAERLKPGAEGIRSSLCRRLTSERGLHWAPTHQQCVLLSLHGHICVCLFMYSSVCDTHFCIFVLHLRKLNVLTLSLIMCRRSLEEPFQSRCEPLNSTWYSMRSCLVCEATSNRDRLLSLDFFCWLVSVFSSLHRLLLRFCFPHHRTGQRDYYEPLHQLSFPIRLFPSPVR